MKYDEAKYVELLKNAISEKKDLEKKCAELEVQLEMEKMNHGDSLKKAKNLIELTEKRANELNKQISLYASSKKRFDELYNELKKDIKSSQLELLATRDFFKRKKK